MNTIKLIFTLLVIIFLLTNCDSYTPEELEYIKSIEETRAETDEWMKDNPNSPFNYKGKIDFHGLKYFDVDPDFVFKSKIIEYDDRKTIPIYGTKGEERSAVRFGYLPFSKDEEDYRLNLYANVGQDSTIYYSIWFTDQTTNMESYGVGRYLSFELKPNKDHIYTIDFNQAFNPYCAYSADYSCAIPSKEDYLDLAINAGEKKYHD
jgi:uncharacterized protein (DUF1684 family)